MKVFIGSSTEATEDLRLVSSWVEELQMQPLAWDDPDVFLPGDNTLAKLVEISTQVDAAIFIFSEDDTVWYRSDGMSQPRDNILIEYGLFVGQLGPKRAIICRKGQPKTASDLRGLTYIDLDPSKRAGARVRLLAWARALSQRVEDPAITELTKQLDSIRRERDELKERLTFEQQKAHDLGRILSQLGSIDFSTYDVGADGHWKLLFDYDYFWYVVKLFARERGEPAAWRKLLEALRLERISSRIPSYQDNNADRTEFFVAKTLRVLRRYERESGPSQYALLVQHLPEQLRGELARFAAERAKLLSAGQALDA